ncbi:Inner membrane protein YhhQ [Enhygromyxa salina]|uniref:Probable queuosine precursor transporter n=1 Tax=Enhygromyxa salina TaxID=215803 RepID=A0A2S9YH06_9BACT|nr:queuosine precursor transporter [Enhygromyxa salina]PRQ04379.1 Inner membrane protein YhhQ [Enhygromyxa salina]
MTERPIPRLDGDAYEQTYVVLAGLFIASLVACNLIFQKFFILEIPLPGGGTHVFRQSVGIIAYPLTFLVTDILSEIYGARRANQVVVAGLLASVFTTGLVELADLSRSAEFGIGDESFHEVFGLSKIAVFASMMAYLTAQFIDIRLFHFWKRLTKGKHLWLRNNASTITSQVVDTFVVLGLLAAFEAGGITWDKVPGLVLDGLLFKWAFAALDTPLLYLAVGALKRRFPQQTAERLF